MTSNKQISLPSSWSLAKLGEITEINPKLATKLPSELEISFIPMRCVAEMSGEIDLSIIRHYKEVRTGYTHFQDGDVIFAKITPCMENGKVAIVNKLKNGIGFGSTEFHVIRPLAQMPSSFPFFFLIQESMRRDAQRHMSGTAGQLRVPVKYLSEVLFPLPPLPEQHRIVAKIEEFLTRLYAGVEALNKIKLQLKRYRQSVLKAAFEGKLTVVWREAHKSELEPASVLLGKIRAERVKSNKYKELPLLDTTYLPYLPEGWVWARLQEVCFVQGGYAFKSKDYKNSGMPLLRISNINDNKVTFDRDTVFLPDQYQGEYSDFLLTNGEIVIALSGATTGKYGIYDKGEPALLNQRVGRLRFHCQDSVSVSYFFYHMEVIRQEILKKAYGAAQPNISTGDLARFIVPIPPLFEQHRIVEEIEHHLSIADATGKTMEQSLLKAKRLRQSILKKAFEGKLVPQGFNDEPADKLLKRIKAEKARQQASVMTPRSRNRRNPS